MLWKFGFGTGSTLDALLSRETPPSVEELLDEQDILAECKAQNNKLVTYLLRESSVKSLLTWVTSGLDDLDEAGTKAEAEAYKKALESTDVFPPFRKRKGGDGDTDDAADETEKMDEDDISSNLPIGLGEGLSGPEEGDSCDTQRARYPQVAAEILTSELWTIPDTVMNHKDTLLRPFWAAVVPALDDKQPDAWERSERERARLLFWTDADEERERKMEIIRGMWMRVNASFLQKRTTEMIRFIQTLPNIIERMVQHIESPSIQDMLARIIQTEDSVPDIMSWLGEQRLIPRLLALLSPEYPSSTHSIVAELLKGIISVSAPNSSFNPQGGNAVDQTGTNGPGHKDNRLVRELTSRESINTFIKYMLHVADMTDRDWKGLNEGEPHPADPFVVHPLPSVTSTTSSLCFVCNVVVEIIRRNNSDLAEPYLFNTMRNRLMAIQSESIQEEIGPDEMDIEGEEQRKKLEEALPELADKLAIVHLGNLVGAISDRLGDLHKLLSAPRSQDLVKSALTPNPLTMERFRVIELYAELLHSSNMATLNRVSATGPQYNDTGALTGGLDGLDRLGRALQASETGEEEPAPAEVTTEAQVSQAKELPVSSGSTDYSLTESDDVPLSDDDDHTPSPNSSPKTPVVQEVPPPASPADAERLRNVLERDASGAASPSSGPVVAPAIAASPSPMQQDTPAEPADEAVSTGERLKQQFIKFSVLPKLLDLFFEHANNNFLHHLVYDVLQQILNGQLQRGYNRELIVELFFQARLIHRVLEAQKLNDEIVAARKPRLSYMGHISLIAEELVKFFARCPADLFERIRGSFPQSQWEAFVDGSLRETRARDTQPLAGGKPAGGLGGGLGSHSERSDSESDDDDDAGPTIGEPLSRIAAKQPDSYHDAGDDDDGQMEQFWRPSNARSAGMDSSDDDDDDADWLRPSSGPSRDDDEDDFGTFQSTSKDEFDDDDAWGSFTSVTTDGNSENPFGDDAFAPSSSSKSDSFRSAEPLTPRDWAEAFDREFDSEPQPWNEDTDEVQAIVMPDDDAADVDVVTTPTSSWSFPGDESDDLGEDLPPASTTVGTSTPPDIVSSVSRRAAGLHLNMPRRNSISQNAPPHIPTPEEEREDALAAAATPQHPLGPGVSADTHVEHGMLERTMEDGTVVRVPEDDIVRGVEEAIERRVDSESE